MEHTTDPLKVSFVIR